MTHGAGGYALDSPDFCAHAAFSRPEHDAWPAAIAAARQRRDRERKMAL